MRYHISQSGLLAKRSDDGSVTLARPNLSMEEGLDVNAVEYEIRNADAKFTLSGEAWDALVRDLSRPA